MEGNIYKYQEKLSSRDTFIRNGIMGFFSCKSKDGKLVESKLGKCIWKGKEPGIAFRFILGYTENAHIQIGIGN